MKSLLDLIMDEQYIGRLLHYPGWSSTYTIISTRPTSNSDAYAFNIQDNASGSMYSWTILKCLIKDYLK